MRKFRPRFFLGVILTLSSLSVHATVDAVFMQQLQGKKAGAVVPEHYIVMFKDNAFPGGVNARGRTVARVASDVATQLGVKANFTYGHALKGFSARIPAQALGRLKAMPFVQSVIEDRVVKLNATQYGAPWGLARIDARPAANDATYNYNATGAGVHVYVIDSGIRASHQEFFGRIGNGFTAINDGNGTNDCLGHGTHVAGTIGGSTYGVAKGATLHPIRVFGCNNSSSWAIVLAGVDWVTANHASPAVANMSLGGNADDVADNAVNNSINSGITYVVSAGNDEIDACEKSPARVSAAITVGATDSWDHRAWFSNYGSCVDLFAPGVDILSAWHTADNTTALLEGTSMASPHATGVVATYLQAGNMAAKAMADQLTVSATQNVVGYAGPGSPNRLLYSTDCLRPLYRYFHPGVGDHFYTTAWNEIGWGAYGYVQEGIEGGLAKDGSCETAAVPLYRYYNTNNGDHFYTANYAELGGGAHGYSYEGVQGYISTYDVGSGYKPTSALYRFYNGRDHFYGTNWSEGANARYGYEGVAGYVYSGRQ